MFFFYCCRVLFFIFPAGMNERRGEPERERLFSSSIAFGVVPLMDSTSEKNMCISGVQKREISI